jgi:1-phosphofructokinase family hexose kinase
MILSAGLTPAWQQIMTFRAFRYGEVNRASKVHWCAQGKVLNAGIAAHHLGGPSLTLATVGGSPLAEIEREFAALGVPRRWVVTEASTRVCTTVLDEATGVMTELVENGKPLRPEELAEFRRVYAEEAARASVAVIAGSLPAGTPDGFYRELLERTPCPAVLDFRGAGLLACLDLKPLLVKPNREELAQTFAGPLDDDRQLLDAMRSLNGRGAQWVVITQGPGAVWMTSTEKTYRFDSLPVDEVVNPIGSGDSMAAGMAWAIMHRRQIVDAVRLGISAAAENVRRLETGRLDPLRVQRQAALVRCKEIS